MHAAANAGAAAAARGVVWRAVQAEAHVAVLEAAAGALRGLAVALAAAAEMDRTAGGRGFVDAASHVRAGERG